MPKVRLTMFEYPIHVEDDEIEGLRAQGLLIEDEPPAPPPPPGRQAAPQPSPASPPEENA